MLRKCLSMGQSVPRAMRYGEPDATERAEQARRTLGRNRMDAIYYIAPTLAMTAYAMLMAAVLVG
jgi:hypothetical protein